MLGTNIVANAVGDWSGYKAVCAAVPKDENWLANRRIACLNYMGPNAVANSNRGYSRNHPTVFTPDVVAALSSRNEELRWRNNPWLKRYMQLLAELCAVEADIPAGIPRLVASK